MPERERRRPTYLQTAVWVTDGALSGEEIHDLRINRSQKLFRCVRLDR